MLIPVRGCCSEPFPPAASGSRCSVSRSFETSAFCRLAEYQLVQDDERVYYDQRRSHNHADTGNQRDKLGLDTVRIRAGAECGIVCTRGEADAREEAVVGEDGEGVCEEAEDVDEVAYEEHLGWFFFLVVSPPLCFLLPLPDYGCRSAVPCVVSI